MIWARHEKRWGKLSVNSTGNGSTAKKERKTQDKIKRLRLLRSYRERTMLKWHKDIMRSNGESDEKTALEMEVLGRRRGRPRTR